VLKFKREFRRQRVKKGLDQNLQLLSGHLSAIELQKVTLVNTVHVIRTLLG